MSADGWSLHGETELERKQEVWLKRNKNHSKASVACKRREEGISNGFTRLTETEASKQVNI